MDDLSSFVQKGQQMAANIYEAYYATISQDVLSEGDQHCMACGKKAVYGYESGDIFVCACEACGRTLCLIPLEQS